MNTGFLKLSAAAEEGMRRAFCGVAMQDAVAVNQAQLLSH
jgi:hypothetical protein